MFDKSFLRLSFIASIIVFSSCAKEETTDSADNGIDSETELIPNLPADYYNYANQSLPSYITKDNTDANEITDAGATLGRVLFYDVNLSDNKTISCASCHQQEHAFSDIDVQSTGLDGGLTGRHSMRLINTRFSEEVRFFWDERAETLEDQTTKPIQDHVEMGFSGEDGQPGINDLIIRLNGIEYYKSLFTDAYGDSEITEEKMQFALAQFIRSIQSFDSKFDEGYAAVGGTNIQQDFPNFTDQENLGKRLFFRAPFDGGAGCNTCHRGPEFDIDPDSHNNGVVAMLNSETKEIDMTNMRSPSLRDLLKPDGTSNGPFMHDGSLATLMDVVNHYDSIPENDNNVSIDIRLNPPGDGLQNLNLTDDQKAALVAFLETLSGNDVYENVIWSNPFDN